MKYYEILYIIHPILEEGRLKDAIKNVEKYLEKNTTNKILYTDYWGKKKLAYPIEKQKYGNYVLIQFSGDGKNHQEFNLNMEQNPNILSHLTTSIKEIEILEQKEDLDSQITGLEKGSNKEYKKEEVKPEEETESKQETVDEKIELSQKEDKKEEDKLEEKDEAKEDEEVEKKEKNEDIVDSERKKT